MKFSFIPTNENIDKRLVLSCSFVMRSMCAFLTKVEMGICKASVAPQGAPGASRSGSVAVLDSFTLRKNWDTH